MAWHRSFSSEFKRQIAKEFLDGRAGLHELARRHSLHHDHLEVCFAGKLAVGTPAQRALAVNPRGAVLAIVSSRQRWRRSARPRL